MDVSVIVPIYKVEKYLSECIDSIINQTFRDLQIILVDDGSPDKCGEICDRYAESDSRVIVIHKANGGLSDARNAGLKAATGRYVYFVDSDDYLDNHAISELYTMAENNALDILIYDAVSFDDNPMNTISNELAEKYIAKKCYQGIFSGAELFAELVDNRDYRSPVQYLFFRRAFLQEKNLVFHRGILHEDEEFTFLALLFADRVMHIPQVLYHHRIREDSIMGMKFSKANTDSIYEVFQMVINNYAFFLNDANTSSAYIKGIGRLAKCFMDYKDCSDDGKSKETRQQFRSVKHYFKENNFFYDSEIISLFDEYQKRHALSRRLKRFAFSHKWFKKSYCFMKSIVRR